MALEDQLQELAASTNIYKYLFFKISNPFSIKIRGVKNETQDFLGKINFQFWTKVYYRCGHYSTSVLMPELSI